jgi:hypothetical protein
VSSSALAGLFALNALYLICGLVLLWLVRGFATWLELARLAGLAYFVGLSGVGLAWTLLLIAGAPFGRWTIVVVPVAIVAGSSLLGRRVGRTLPGRPQIDVRRTHFVAAVGIAATGVFFEALFRASRLAGVYWWDAWSFWLPKAKALYHFGEIDVHFFTTLPGPSYPPLIPVLDAAAFHAMGGTDVVTLHVQYWLFGVAFVWGLAGLLAERTPAWILWPFVLVALVAPRIGRHMFVSEADLFLDFLFVLAAVLVAYWLHDSARWQLVVATLLMSGMVMTKREGLLLAGVVLVAALVASAREWRYTAPRIGLAALAVVAVALPWRVWYLANGAEGEGAGAELVPDTGRLWPSLRLAFDVLFSSGYWSVAVAAMVGAVVLGLVVESYRLAAFFGVLVTLVTLGGGWFTWAIEDLPITQEAGGNPIVRYMGAAALACIAAGPLLLAAAWRVANANEGGTA